MSLIIFDENRDRNIKRLRVLLIGGMCLLNVNL